MYCILNGCANEKEMTTDQKNKLQLLKNEVSDDLTRNLLPYWSSKMIDTINGGFYGRVDSKEQVYSDADKGGILNARILWTFSSAFRIMNDSSYLRMATYARDYIMTYFIDEEFGGAYMTVKSNGEPSDTRKQILTESYFIYALAEHYRATGDQEALAKAREIFESVEKYAFDKESNGYFEVFTRDWKRSPDLLLGERSAKDEKTMITHLHLVEAYAGLYRVWPEKRMEERLRNILEIFNDKIVDKKTYHLIYFLDRDWNATTTIDSYGHDIEASWLIDEAARLLKDPELISRVRKLSIKIADAASEGLREDGSMLTEKDNSIGHVVTIRSWWEQAESVVGYLNAFEITGDQSYLDKSINSWNYIKRHFVDKTNGGWHSLILETGEPGTRDKAGFWTCPYHNGRMCMEVIERIRK
ncbi:MAG: AGE family epimerase/isomerase [Cyclobacteriaceae bacterium]|nr:AGE family epimerase/isomerase [Cyclobacteriaceae bacterium]